MSTGAESAPLCLKRERRGDKEQGEREHGALTFLETWEEKEQKSGCILRRCRTVRDVMGMPLFVEF